MTELRTLSASQQFDDRVDVETEISSAEAAIVLGRTFRELGAVKALFAAKFVLSLGMLISGLFVPWMGKIVIDNVLLGKPFGTTDVLYPPFMDPIINLLDGMGPLEIMLTLMVIYLVLQFIVGIRTGGINAELFEGSEAATQSENLITDGGSNGGGLWGLAEFWVTARLTQGLSNSLRTKLFRRLTRLPMTTVDDQRFGDSVYRVMYDVPWVWDACNYMTLVPFYAVVGALINLYLLEYSFGTVAPELIWLAWAVLPLAFIVTFPFSGLMRRVHQNKRAAGSAATNSMEEAVNNIDAVQSLGGMETEKGRFAKSSAESFLRERYGIVVEIVLYVAVTIVGVGGSILVTYIITNRIIEGTMTPGDFFLLFGIFYQMVQSGIYIGGFWIHLQEPVAAMRRVFFFLDFDVEADRKGTLLPPVRQGVEFENVSFRYPDGRHALNNVNLELPVGELVAFVGPTGAGKTSLAYLIPAFLAPTTGRVLIDGRDVAGANLDSLRAQIAYVFQEHLLLSASIRENLLLANPEATEVDMYTALETAGCMDFIDPLPARIDTPLGRSGNTLSVGQQQRLSIARGLVRDARILILDEPTAALDPQTENALLDAVLTAKRDRLIIVIAHRLSTIRRANRIIFLEDGEVADDNSHDALMANPASRYRRFVELQGV
ncbi:MAG: ABC transporter ATP-binding protein [Gammaproteobacteria bacterium]|nr:ABC transporter ATP-binding protein [Gammaproteobacteria bacterium]